MNEVERNRRNNRNEANSRLISRLLARTPMTKPDICTQLGIDEHDFDAALRYSRTNADPAQEGGNQIIGVTASHPFLYYVAKSVEQADAYITQRAKLADGHLKSVELLLVKELQKYPAKSREINLNLTAVRRMREDMVYLLTD